MDPAERELLGPGAGDALAADGVVMRGDSAVDLALLTGESRPVSVRAGDAVYAGTGAVRVIDYKTSDKGVSPLAAHVRSARRDETAPDWARFTVDGKDLVWTDLQLPLYLEALAGEMGVAVGAGYFNLPKAVGAAFSIGIARRMGLEETTLAKDGVVFENAFSNSTWTRPSVSTKIGRAHV